MGRDFVRQWEAELMGEHADLAAVVSFVRKHVAEHVDAGRPGDCPAITKKSPDAAAIRAAERFGKHLRAASGTLGERGLGLLWCAASAIELAWNY